MVRTLLSDHGRIAVGALVGAVAAALFAEGLISGPERGVPGDGLTISKDGGRNPEPVPAMPGVVSVSQVVPTTSAAPTTTTTRLTTTTTTKKSSSTTTTTTATTTTTTTRPTTTTTTTRPCHLLC